MNICLKYKSNKNIVESEKEKESRLKIKKRETLVLHLPDSSNENGNSGFAKF